MIRRLVRLLVAGVVLVGIGAVGRAALAERCWTMAHLWCRLPPVAVPSFWALLSPRSYWHSLPGVYADTVYLRTPYSPRDESRLRSALYGLSAEGETVPLPLAPARTYACVERAVFRMDPNRTGAEHWAACAGEGKSFPLDRVRQGEAWRVSGARGGLVVLDTKEHLLYVIAYRTE